MVILRTFIVYLLARCLSTAVCSDLSLETTANVPGKDAIFDSVDSTTGTEVLGTEYPTAIEQKIANHFLTTTENDGIATTYETPSTVTEELATAGEDSKKVIIDDVEGSNTTVKDKPVQEPPFIKKYWPLLCFKTICDRRHHSPVIPSVNAEVVRSDIEETRSSDEILRAIESDIVVDNAPSATTDSSSEEDDIERQRYKIKSSVAEVD